MSITSCCIYTNASVMVNEFAALGTLLDVVNAFQAHKKQSQVTVVSRVTVTRADGLRRAARRVLCHSHYANRASAARARHPARRSQARQLHDARAHVRYSTPGHTVGCSPNGALTASSLAAAASPIRLIDFGRAIDLRHTAMPENVRFTSRCSTNKFVCPHMLDGVPWSVEVR